ncbi:hypothetical protein FACS1894163_05060 [Spirochaetia bacterium]|nr:hypothetical protein FACS1894163_05060 [Spirochaetia bacterium]
MKIINNSNLPLVSVIIPCYNCEKYVELAVQSIIDQTYPNLEILITDDCSTDNSYNILKELAQNDSRIILIKNEANLKLAKSLNNMIDMAKGKYIARMDADDISLSERIMTQVEWMEAHSDYAICGTNAWVMNSNEKIIRKSILPATNEEINNSKYCRSPFYHPTVMLRTDVIKIYKYNEKFPLAAEDYELWFRMLKNCKGYNLKQRLLKYRDLSGSISNTNQDKNYEMRIRIIANNVTNNDFSLAEKYVTIFQFRHSGDLYNSDLKKLIIELYKNIKNCDGYNFYILIYYFFYFFRQKNIGIFISHLSIIGNIKFCIKFIYYLINSITISFIKKLYCK